MADVAAHGGAQLLVEQGVEELVLQIQRQRNLALLRGLGIRHRDADAGVEDLALAAVLGLEHGRVVDLLEDARHGEDEIRLEGLQVLEQVLDVRGMPGAAAGSHVDHRDETGEYVGQRQEHDG